MKKSKIMNKFRLMSVFVVLAMLFSFVQVSPAEAAATNPESCQDILDANPRMFSPSAPYYGLQARR
jgi:hypothetical protein